MKSHDFICVIQFYIQQWFIKKLCLKLKILTHLNPLNYIQYVYTKTILAACNLGEKCSTIYKACPNDGVRSCYIHRPGILWALLTFVVRIKFIHNFSEIQSILVTVAKGAKFSGRFGFCASRHKRASVLFWTHTSLNTELTLMNHWTTFFISYYRNSIRA